MKILIIEDEVPAAKRLKSLILEAEPSAEILTVIDEVTVAVDWLKSNEHPDLIFMDIQLADGFSFQIFEKIEVKSAVIFATAFDEYAIKAFKVNGLDYLLKPIKKEELAQSIDRFKKLKLQSGINLDLIQNLFAQQHQKYKDRFLVKSGDQLNYVKVTEIAYFISEGSYSFLVAGSGNRFILDDSLDQIEQFLDPKYFFRINRKMIVGIESVQKIAPYFNNRLKLELSPADTNETIVSRQKVKEFKSWLDS